MRYVVTKQIIEVIGVIWIPAATCAQRIELSAYDLANIEDPTDRDSVEHWLLLHSGDFQSIADFRADFTIEDKPVVHEWNNEDSELIFNDCMYPNFDEDDA